MWMRIGQFPGVCLVTVTGEQRMIQLPGEFAQPINAIGEIPMRRPRV
jgi:hypothetical protein